MPATVIDIQNTDDARDVVHRAVEALAGGHLVAFPTETVYGVAACARHPSPVERLLAAWFAIVNKGVYTSSHRIVSVTANEVPDE